MIVDPGGYNPDNALLATSGKEFYGKNLVNENFEGLEEINQAPTEDNKKSVKLKDKVDNTNKVEAKDNLTDNNNDQGDEETNEDEEFLSLTSIEEIINRN